MTTPKPLEMTLQQVHELSQVLLSKKAQDELMNNEQAPNRWMLDYVYDSKLRAEFDKLGAF